MIYEDCPDRIEVVAFAGTPVRYVCGCRRCLPPDPTPQQLQVEIDREWVAFNLGLASR